MKKITYSRMESFGCPHKFSGQYVEASNTITSKRDQETSKETSPALEFGKASHDVMAEFINNTIDGTMPLGKNELIEQVFKRYQIDPVRFTEFSEVCHNGMKNLFDKISFTDIQEVEETWEIDLDHNDWILELTPDLVLNTKEALAVVDHKSDQYKRTIIDLNDDWQTSVYAWALHREYGVDKVLVAMHFIRYRGFVPSIRDGEETFEAIGNQIKMYCDKIDECLEKKSWPRLLSPGACKYCKERVECLTAMNDGISGYGESQILTLAGNFKRTATALENRAKELMKNRDPIEIEGKKYGYTQVQGKTPECDKDVAINIFDEANVPWKHLCTLSNANIQKIVKKADPEVQGKIENASEFPIKSKFNLP